jgi:hypothetical protein
MRTRFDDALFIHKGACNPAAIAIAIHHACKAAMEEVKSTDGVRADPAVRLMTFQLAFLTGVSSGFDASGFDIDEAVQACVKRASPETLATCGLYRRNAQAEKLQRRLGIELKTADAEIWFDALVQRVLGAGLLRPFLRALRFARGGRKTIQLYREMFGGENDIGFTAGVTGAMIWREKERNWSVHT